MSTSGANPATPGLVVLPTVLVVAKNLQELRSNILTEFDHGGIFIAGTHDYRVGDELVVDLALASDLLGVQLPGVVKWKRVKPQGALKAGMGVAFGIDGERILRLLDGEARDALFKRSRRFYVRLPADVKCGDQWQSGLIYNISRTGILYDCPAELTIEARYPLRMRPAPLVNIDIEVDVVRKVGESTNYGMRLAKADEESTQRLRQLLGQVQAQAVKR